MVVWDLNSNLDVFGMQTFLRGLGGAFLNMVFFTTMFTTADVNIHALIAKYGIDIQIVRPEMTKFKMFRSA
jgi:hypothetical protein